jgi:hypothetical protein
MNLRVDGERAGDEREPLVNGMGRRIGKSWQEIFGFGRKANTMKIEKVLIVGGLWLAGFGVCNAQAPPGPIQPSPNAVPVESAPPPAAAKKPEAKPRNDILGAWKWNAQESDNPRDKLQQARENSGSNGGNRGGMGGGPHIGFPGGGMGGPGMGGGSHGADTEGLEEKINPPLQMNLSQKTSRDPEVDLTDDQNRKKIFYTDGRKLQKSKDNSSEEISAKWEGLRLVTDEKGPRGQKLTREYELSSDGLQLWESVKINTGHGNYPVTMRFVYDAVDLPGKPTSQASN